jgi:hypothetical protein
LLTSEAKGRSVLTSRPQGGVLTSGGVSRSVLAGDHPEENGGHAEENDRSRELSGVQVITEDAEADAEGAGGDVVAGAEECGEDLAYCQEESDDAGDTAREQLRPLSPLGCRVAFRHEHLSGSFTVYRGPSIMPVL